MQKILKLVALAVVTMTLAGCVVASGAGGEEPDGDHREVRQSDVKPQHEVDAQCAEMPDGTACAVCDLAGKCVDGDCVQVEQGPPKCG